MSCRVCDVVWARAHTEKLLKYLEKYTVCLQIQRHKSLQCAEAWPRFTESCSIKKPQGEGKVSEHNDKTACGYSNPGDRKQVIPTSVTGTMAVQTPVRGTAAEPKD